jgi:hypothetical protein
MAPDLRPKLILPASTTSPVGRLLPLVAHSLANIAPERIEALKPVLAGLSIEVIEDTAWVMHFLPSRSTIVLSTGAVEVCWAASFAYATFYDRVLVNRTPDMPRAVDLTVDPQVRAAMRLLEWAFKNFAGGRRAPWQEDLPRPIANPAHASPAHVADELALCTLGFFMHHELAHHRLGHAPSDESTISIDQERDADYEAAYWVLAAVAKSTREFTKRVHGVATGLALLVAHGIHTRDFGGRTHPRSFDRLLFTLDRYLANDKNHDAWAFAVGILSLHLCSKEVTLEDPSDDSFRGWVEAAVEKLADP